ncbi:ribbon-helix-helix protein, CopG family [Planctomycetales bacterium ZRK34]|nr:ribbon-helix-helix protein, CopG family [Planctomycetales bacterium ZRK34]
MPRNYENLSIVRQARQRFLARLEVRLTPSQLDRLQKLSVQNGRSVSEMIRSAIDLICAASQVTERFDQSQEVRKLRKNYRVDN